MHDVVIVVPCYNEEKRIDTARFLELSRGPGVALLFVNDGSKDGTEAVLDRMVAESDGSIAKLSLEKNSGKAEAVRRGLLHAIAMRSNGPTKSGAAAIVGFADADLATPPDELVRLVDVLRHDAVDVVMGSRVALAGSRIDRKAGRHYMGRIFASATSLALHARFYDTQCGAKFFRSTPLLRAALEDRFHSRWIFDVELLGRLLAGSGGHPGIHVDAFLEVPLRRWVDVDGSKVRFNAILASIVELGVIAVDLEKRRRK